MIYPMLVIFIYRWPKLLLTTVIWEEQPWIRNSQTHGLVEVDLYLGLPENPI
jgi:hypothetical protein